MAKANAVWGIDIGQSSLKALRCVKGADDRIVADGYDYIEYPKILSAADADPVELVKEALEQFLSRNEVIGDKVAISVPGQAGLSRFFKPPPVDARKLPNLVEFEVSQQIPFPIEDVIWDWQQLGGTKDEEGRIADAEVGLFAMKRDAVFRALKPFDDAGVEVDIVQLSPLSIFNVVCNDQIDEIPTPEDFDPEYPPESIVVLSMGTDTTDLIVTNGIKLWMRNIPIGGNHFTKQLSREMKLTQAKAEHLKRNAKMAENPKAVFQAMRPVFNDLVNETQRSLTFFQSMDKSAMISEVVLLGNAAKLPGLTQFLGKQLELKVSRASDFKNLTGDEVVSQSTFANNSLSFAPCYGLCLQGLGNSSMKTNLLPTEIVVDRVIRAKKPWVLAAVSLLLLGCSLGLFYKTLAADLVNPKSADETGTTWEEAMRGAKSEDSKSKQFATKDTEQKATLEKFNVIAKELSSSIEDRASWIEIYSAIYQALPEDPRIKAALKESDSVAVDPKEFPFAGREEMYVDYIETVFHKDLGTWHQQIKTNFENQLQRTADTFGTETAPAATDETDNFGGGSTDATFGGFGDEETPTSPLSTKPGWVIEIQAHHFHNEGTDNTEIDFVRSTLLNNLLTGTVEFPDGKFTYEDIGISFPTITRVSQSSEKVFINVGMDDASGMGMGMGGGGRGAGGRGGGGRSGGGRSGGGSGGRSGGMSMGMSMGGPGMGGPGMGMTGSGMGTNPADDENVFEAKVYTFIIQMAWTPRSAQERMEAKKKREEEAAQAEAAAQEAAQAETQQQ